MDTGPGGIELSPDKGEVFRDMFAYGPFIIIPDLGDHSGLDSVLVAGEADIVNNQPLNRGIAGPLTKPKQAAVDP